MRRAALVALALALAAAAGCGSSDDTAKSTPTAAKTATATATPQLESPDVARMPATAPPDATQRPIAPGAVDQDALRAAFDDAQRMWEREFSAAGIAYPPARLTFFSTHVDTVCGEASTGS
jgi:predicted metalloprotease